MGKYTSGPAEVRKTLTSLYVVGGPTEYGRPLICDMPTLSNGAPCEDADGDAALIAEAFNVAHETGLTPRQLAEQRGMLLACLRAEVADLTSRMFGTTHWQGCEEAHPKCAVLKRMQAAIADAEGATP